MGGSSINYSRIYLLEFFTPAPVGSLLASTLWDASWNWALTALPLFIWMGEILFRTRLSSEMFKGLAPMLSICLEDCYMLM